MTRDLSLWQEMMIMTREQIAVRKASKARLLADMRQAALIVKGLGQPDQWSQGYLFGATHHASFTLAACLLTAFGA